LQAYATRVSLLRVELSAGSLHLPELGLWLDAHRAQAGAERVFVSHAHSDHIAAHREVVLTGPTAALMRTRIRGQRQEHLLAFRQRAAFAHGGIDYQLTLLAAGHILGSAMVLVEAGGHSLLYTGDFKLCPGFAAEACEPRRADVLIMETTFGCPKYRFPPAADVMADIIHFCRTALAGGETPMLLGYSLGKSQELLRGLTGAGLPIMVHGPAHKLAKIYEQFGQTFPPYELFDAATARGKVLICPPNSIRSAAFQSLGKLRTAVVTGWAMDSSCRFRSGTDTAFPLSDHADFAELIEMVERVQPKNIYTVHGFTTEFAATLRDRGWDAQALGRQEQLSLKLGP
jgi:Cft2 family RNA processing exonuclease